MPLAARRVFRLSWTVALSLACAYGLQLPLPFLAPLFALVLGANPGPPPGPKSLVGLILVVLITMGVGLLLIPVLLEYPIAAVLLVAMGLYSSTFLTFHMSEGTIGMLLTAGMTLISAAGTVDYALAVMVIQAMVVGIAIAIVCQWVVYPWFPEHTVQTKDTGTVREGPARLNWIALRATLIIMPAYLLVLSNPLMYMSIIMKSVSLAQQSSVVETRHAGRELLGSTFLAGCFAIPFWFGLKIFPSLWMFFLWMLLFGIYFSAKLYGLLSSRFPASFWLNTAVTMLILLGPAVEDSANGKDVYAAFAVRMGLFIVVALYAWLAVFVLEQLRGGRANRVSCSLQKMESH